MWNRLVLKNGIIVQVVFVIIVVILIIEVCNGRQCESAADHFHTTRKTECNALPQKCYKGSEIFSASDHHKDNPYSQMPQASSKEQLRKYMKEITHLHP
jgi:hypothetical protein